MDFEFFEKLSKDDANTLLRRFLDVESSHTKGTLRQCAADGIKMDFSIKSIAPYMRWILKQIITIPKKPDPSAPKWIRNTESYAKHLFEFDEPSGALILRAGYYLGESFVRSHSSLRWSTGDIETALGNMPVVVGFQKNREMAPILIAENILGRIIGDSQKLGDIEIAVGRWNSMVPN